MSASPDVPPNILAWVNKDVPPVNDAASTHSRDRQPEWHPRAARYRIVAVSSVMIDSTFRIDRRVKAKIAAFVVIAFLTLSFVSLGFTALGEASSNSASVQQSVGGEGDNTAVSAFKFVCPFH